MIATKLGANVQVEQMQLMNIDRKSLETFSLVEKVDFLPVSVRTETVFKFWSVVSKRM